MLRVGDFARLGGVTVRAAAAGRLLVVLRMDHVLTQHPDARAAFRNIGRGEYAAGAAEEVLAFVNAPRN